MKTNKIVPVNEVELAEASWTQIVDFLIENLNDEDLPDSVMKAAELLLVGWPAYKVAKKVGVQTATIKKWVIRYPMIGKMLARSREMMSRWRMTQLNQQLSMAMDLSERVLTIAHEDEEDKEKPLNIKLLGIQAQHARYVMNLFFDNNSKFDIAVVNLDASQNLNLQVAEDALKFLSSEVKETIEGSEPIEVHYRVIDTNKEVPILKEDGTPHHGEFGKLDINSDGIQCHICGNRYKNLAIHVQTYHEMPADIYEVEFQLDEGGISV